MSEDKDHIHSISVYKTSGIEERHGFVPAWLAVVYAIMLIWMVWYLIAFWTDRG